MIYIILIVLSSNIMTFISFKSWYHICTVFFSQLGWRKWGAEHPDWYARSAAATSPDWYTRRVENIRGGHTKMRLWHYERPQKPTEKQVYGLYRDPPRPWQRGYQAVPHNIEGQVQMPKHGLYNPPHYQEPGRVEPLPPLHIDQKHL